MLTDASCAALAPDATAEQLLPHDAAFVLEGSGADLVLIEAAALLPGGAWAHAGDPAAADRGRRLADLIDLARALGKPVIFLRNAPVLPACRTWTGWARRATRSPTAAWASNSPGSTRSTCPRRAQEERGY